MARASLHFLNHPVLAAALPGNGGGVELPLPEKARHSKVLILGGTGRVGGSTARALSKFCPSLRLLIAGRNRARGTSLVSTLGENSEFVEVDIDNVKSLEAALNGVDLVVHAAGPFQREEKCNVLEAAIATKTAYVDVCDDTDYAWRAKAFHNKAVDAGVPAITTAGIYPGMSNDSTQWDINLRRDVMDEEETGFYELLTLLHLVVIQPQEEDQLFQALPKLPQSRTYTSCWWANHRPLSYIIKSGRLNSHSKTKVLCGLCLLGQLLINLIEGNGFLTLISYALSVDNMRKMLIT